MFFTLWRMICFRKQQTSQKYDVSCVFTERVTFTHPQAIRDEDELVSSSDLLVLVFYIYHPFLSKCLLQMRKRIKSNLIRIFLWRTKVSEAVCKCDTWGHIYFLTCEKFRQTFRTQCAMTFTQQWMGAVRMRAQTADKNITIIHTTPVHQLMAWEDKSCVFVRNKSIIKMFLNSNCCFCLKYKSIINNNVSSSERNPSLSLLSLTSKSSHIFV